MAELALNRPKKGNSISVEMSSSIVDAVRALVEDNTVRVIVLTGSGESFCTGMDLNLNPAQTSPDMLLERGTKGIDMFEALYHCKKPIIARINGPALGGGWGLVFTTDLRVALRKAFFWIPDVKRGIVPAIISCYIVPEVGICKAKDLMLTGRKVTADEAKELGVVNVVVDTIEELDAKVKEYTDQLLASATTAMAETKTLINYITHPHTHKDNLQRAKHTFARAVSGKEAKYGIEKFHKKETPDWTAFAKL